MLCTLRAFAASIDAHSDWVWHVVLNGTIEPVTVSRRQIFFSFAGLVESCAGVSASAGTVNIVAAISAIIFTRIDTSRLLGKLAASQVLRRRERCGRRPRGRGVASADRTPRYVRTSWLDHPGLVSKVRSGRRG